MCDLHFIYRSLLNQKISNNINWPIKRVLILLLGVIPKTNAYDGDSPLDDVFDTLITGVLPLMIVAMYSGDNESRIIGFMDDVIIFLLPIILSFITIFTSSWIDLDWFVIIPGGIFFVFMFLFYGFYQRINEIYKKCFRLMFYMYCILVFVAWVVSIPLTTIDTIHNNGFIDVILSAILVVFFWIFTIIIVYRRRSWRSSIVITLLNANFLMFLYVGICLEPYSQYANKAAVGSWILSLTRFFQHNELACSNEAISMLVLLTDGK
ncbi:hypothetical protein C1645_817167 [Glomus cerebriforme]|uniref:Uncharacterized protein n=1 Tax=Glomus cerebriforme TaxID=658196 RepID=A0A397TJK2_9GLOM|nr:hypothetical protein C1645_817167 [Glomus cerebriforme]